MSDEEIVASAAAAAYNVLRKYGKERLRQRWVSLVVLLFIIARDEEVIPKEKSIMKTGVDVREATHVKIGGQFEKIVSKSGIDPDGRLAKPSQGGFSVTTESGRTVSMWEAQSYGKEE